MATLYTMGQPGDPDLRGESMVQKHAEKLRIEKENSAFQRLTAAFPDLGRSVLALALEEAKWEVADAIDMLKRFTQAAADHLTSLKQSHKRARSEAEDDSSDESDESSDDSEEEGWRKKRKGKKNKRRKEKKNKKSKDKKAKKHEEEAAVPASKYGKYGVIRESDFGSKQAEFMQWAAEVKKVDVDVLPKGEERELFAEYMEDYNTATLPSKKYYNAEAYAARMAAKAARKGGKSAGEKAMFDDEEERRRELAAQRAEDASERLKEAYNEIKYTAPDKAKDMREQEIMRMQMSLAYRTGDHSTAAKLAERLMPDEKREVIEQRRRNVGA